MVSGTGRYGDNEFDIDDHGKTTRKIIPAINGAVIYDRSKWPQPWIEEEKNVIDALDGTSVEVDDSANSFVVASREEEEIDELFFRLSPVYEEKAFKCAVSSFEHNFSGLPKDPDGIMDDDFKEVLKKLIAENQNFIKLYVIL